MSSGTKYPDVKHYVRLDADDRVSVLTPEMRELLYGPMRALTAVEPMPVPDAPAEDLSRWPWAFEATAPTEESVADVAVVPEPVMEVVAEPEPIAEPVMEVVAEPEPIAEIVLEPEPTVEYAVEQLVEPEPELEPELLVEPEPFVALAPVVVPAVDELEEQRVEPAVADPQPPAGRRHRGRLLLRVLRRCGSLVMAALTICVFVLSVGPRFLPFQAFYIRSGSMRPSLPIGSLVIATRVPAANLHVGDIIVFGRPDHPGDTVTHRIVGVEDTATGKQFVTKGDANGAADSWRVPAVGDGWRYKASIPYAGYAVGYLQSTLTMIGSQGLFVIAAMVAALRHIWRKPREKRKHAETAAA